MKRVTKFFKEWYMCPGGMLLGIPCGLAVVLALFASVGKLSLDLLVY